MEIQRRENRCILRIKDAHPDDEAEFKCECGEVSTICKVKVTGQYKVEPSVLIDTETYRKSHILYSYC